MPLCNTDINKPVDCSKYGGYDGSDLCMQTCASEVEMSNSEMCSARCLSYETTFNMNTGGAWTPEERDICRENCVTEVESYPEPMGCFKDNVGRDLRYVLGVNLSLQECIDLAKEKMFDYIGM